MFIFANRVLASVCFGRFDSTRFLLRMGFKTVGDFPVAGDIHITNRLRLLGLCFGRSHDLAKALENEYPFKVCGSTLRYGFHR